MDAEAPLFMLYTSGSTGKPKGVLHSTAGYMLYAATTFKYSFDAQLDDVYWCTADIGWITGHSYVTYGPLLNAATSVLFEGIPFYPDHKRCWQIIAEHMVSKFYTAPTAIRSLMKFGLDISPVINSYTDALLDMFPQDRYQPMDLYFKTRVWIAHHLPEIVYELLYIGHAKR